MLSKHIKKLARAVKLKRGPKPLVSGKKDIALLRKVRGKKLPRLKQLGHMHRVLTINERRAIAACTVLAVFGLVWGGFVLVGKYRIQVPKVGGQYVEAVVGSPQLINPIFSSLNDVDRDITTVVYSGLMRYDKNQQLIPDLASTYEISDDKKIYTFTLRDDVVWHDGTPLSSNDVVFTIQTIQDPLVSSPLFVSFQGVEVEALDDKTVRFVLSEPFSPFLSSLTVGLLPEHVWFDVAPERMRLHNQNLQPVGTGPYLFKKLTKDETGFIFNYELTRFDRYYDQPPFVEELTFQFFGEYEGPAGAIQALRSGRVDGLSFVPHDLRDKVERKHIRLHTLQLPQYTGLFFNQDKQPILEDQDVRQAMALALDKDRILRESLADEGQIIYSPILPGFPGYNPELEKIAYDTQVANELLDKDWERVSAEDFRSKRREELLEERKIALEESTDNSEKTSETESESADTAEDGEESVSSTEQLALEQEIERLLDTEISPAQTFYRKNDDGEFLTLRLVTANTQEYQQASALMAGFWQEIGIQTIIEFVDAKDISRTVLKGRNYDMLLFGIILGSDPDQFPFWHSSQVDFPGLNLSRYVNRNADALLDEIRLESDEEKIIELYKKLQDLILKDDPAIFLYIPTYTYATTDKINGVDIARIFHPADRFNAVNEWYIDTRGRWNFN